MFPDLPKSFAPAMGTAVVRQDWGKKIGTNKLGSQIDTYKLGPQIIDWAIHRHR